VSSDEEPGQSDSSFGLSMMVFLDYLGRLYSLSIRKTDMK